MLHLVLSKTFVVEVHLVNFQFPMSFIDRGAKFVVWRSYLAAVAAAAITLVSSNNLPEGSKCCRKWRPTSLFDVAASVG